MIVTLKEILEKYSNTHTHTWRQTWGPTEPVGPTPDWLFGNTIQKEMPEGKVSAQSEIHAILCLFKLHTNILTLKMCPINSTLTSHWFNIGNFDETWKTFTPWLLYTV